MHFQSENTCYLLNHLINFFTINPSRGIRFSWGESHIIHFYSSKYDYIQLDDQTVSFSPAEVPKVSRLNRARRFREERRKFRKTKTYIYLKLSFVAVILSVFAAVSGAKTFFSEQSKLSDDTGKSTGLFWLDTQMRIFGTRFLNKRDKIFPKNFSGRMYFLRL